MGERLKAPFFACVGGGGVLTFVGTAETRPSTGSWKPSIPGQAKGHGLRWGGYSGPVIE